MFDPAPFPPVTFNSHILLGAVGFAGAGLALLARKGSKIHVTAGRVMVVSMLVSCVTALLFMLHKFSAPPVMNSMTALCGLVAAVLVLRPTSATVKAMEIVFSVALLLTLLWFASRAMPNIVSGQVFVLGPIVVALAAVIFLVGDVHYFSHYAQRAELRIRRHMVRMIWSAAVLVRAPLFELRDELGLGLPLVLGAPMLVAFVMTIYFWPKAKSLSAA